MAQFPVQDSGITDAVNYLLSGPSGLGQNFKGFSSYLPSYLTGNFRVPFGQPTLANLYIAPIPCTSVLQLDDRTFQYNFTTTQSSPPFIAGSDLRGDGWTNDFFNGGWNPIGVVACTTTYVLVRTSSNNPGIGDDTSGGTVSLVLADTLISTDCNARVTVTGASDRVFISGQLDQALSYTGAGDLVVLVDVNRYRGFLNSDPVNPDYLFNLDGTVAEKSYSFSSLSGPGTLPIETIFSTLIDQPQYPYNSDPATPWSAYYWYILEIRFTPTDSLIINSNQFGLRSLSAQVVKQ
jgi:hypothetical protein